MTSAIEHELETLLRGEIAAAETYNQILDEIDDPEAAPLREIQNHHGEAIKFLYQSLTERGVEAPASSGMWGFFARTVEGTAKLLSDKAALTALREGERKGLGDYVTAVRSSRLPNDCRAYIEQRLIPAQRRHIDVLSRLIVKL